MSSNNLIYPFATEAASGNILSDGEYGLSTERLSGNVPGIAKQQLVNKAAKQAAAIAYAVAEAAALRTDSEISDDGSGLTALVNYLKVAFIPSPVASHVGKYLRINSAYNGVEYVSLPASSTSVAGIIQTATTAEVETGVDTIKAATPAGVKAAIDSAIEPLAPAASPTFTGTPQTVTPATSDNSTKIASTAYVINRIANDRPYSTATPAMNGTATAGSSANVSRGDHVHPVDTSRAAVNSPTFTGVPAAPTAPSGTNTTQLATTAFVKNAADNKVSDAIGDGVIDKAPSQNAVYDALLLKAPVASPALTGIPTVPTAAEGTNTTQAASTAFVKTAVDAKVSDAIVDGETSKAPTQNAVYDALASKADLASPAFTGTPSAPTAPLGTNTTQIATTAFVKTSMHTLDPTVNQDDITKEHSLAWWIAYFNGNEATVRIPRGTHEVLYDMTIPENICLQFDKGAILEVASGKTLTINGCIEAGLWQIFGGLGIVLGDSKNVAVGEVYPQWWGADSSGVNDSAKAIQAAIAFLSATYTPWNVSGGWYCGGGTVKLSRGIYSLHSGIILGRNISIIGDGWRSTYIAVNSGVECAFDSTVGQFSIQNLTINMSGSSVGIRSLRGYDSLICDVHINGGTHGIIKMLTVNEFIERVRCFGQTTVGISVSGNAGVGPCTSLYIKESACCHSPIGIRLYAGPNAIHTSVIENTILEYNSIGVYSVGEVSVKMSNMHFEGSSTYDLNIESNSTGKKILSNCGFVKTVIYGSSESDLNINYKNTLISTEGTVLNIIRQNYAASTVYGEISKSSLIPAIWKIDQYTYRNTGTVSGGKDPQMSNSRCTYNVGDRVLRRYVGSGDFNIGWICTADGTSGTMPSETGSITEGTNTLTLATGKTLTKNEFITIAGVDGVFRVVSVDDNAWSTGKNAILDRNSNVTVTGATIMLSPPTFRTFGIQGV